MIENNNHTLSERWRQKIEIERIHRLFSKVLLLACKDAFGPNAMARKRKKIRKEALVFFHNECDFKNICFLAGVEYEDFLEIVLSKKNNKEKYKKIILYFYDKSNIFTENTGI